MRRYFTLLGLCVVLAFPAAALQGQEKPKKDEKPESKELVIDLGNGVKLEMVRVPKGKFWMGGGGGKAGEKQVEVSEFYIGKFAVTQEQYETIMGENPSYFSAKGKGKAKVQGMDTAKFPVEHVSWDDAKKFIEKLNGKKLHRGLSFRLPSEAEWEYACRGGATSQEECSYHFYFDKPTNDLSSDQANFNGNYPFGNAGKSKDLWRTTKVGSYKPNRLGIYDMHGNVWQWCEDLYLKDGRGDRVFRGGSWYNLGEDCRAAHRSCNAPDDRNTNRGFRLAASPSQD